MKQIYPIGKMLHEYRTRKGISQEQLCGTLIAVSTLSRIERGERMPDRKTAEYLFTKLGLDAPVGLVPMTDAEYERFCLEVQIRRKMGESDYNVKELLERYKSISEKFKPLEEQFYKLHYALYAKYIQQLGHAVIKKILVEAMKLSFPNYEEEMPLKDHFFSKTELVILNNIARENYGAGDSEKGINQMMSLKNYFENPYIENRTKNTMYTVILFNLTNWIGLAGRHKEAIALAEEGIAFDSTHGRLNYFPLHIFNKGFALAMMGRKEEGREFIDLAYRNFEVMGRHDMVVQTAAEVNRLFGFKFKET